jgi:hypothetical protein
MESTANDQTSHRIPNKLKMLEKPYLSVMESTANDQTSHRIPKLKIVKKGVAYLDAPKLGKAASWVESNTAGDQTSHLNGPKLHFRENESTGDMMKKLQDATTSLMDNDIDPSDLNPSQHIAPINKKYGSVTAVPSGYNPRAYPAILFKAMPHDTPELNKKVQKKLKRVALKHILKSIDMEDKITKPCLSVLKKQNNGKLSKAYGGMLAALIKYANKELQYDLKQIFVGCKDFAEKFINQFTKYRSNFYIACSMFVDLDDITKQPPKAGKGYVYENWAGAAKRRRRLMK